MKLIISHKAQLTVNYLLILFILILQSSDAIGLDLRPIKVIVGFDQEEVLPHLAKEGYISEQVFMDSLFDNPQAFISGSELIIKLNLKDEEWGCFKGSKFTGQPFPPLPLRIRYFDENGNYLGHFQTKELFTPDWTLPYMKKMNLEYVTSVKPEGIPLVYSINARDAHFAMFCEISFGDIQRGSVIKEKDIYRGKSSYYNIIEDQKVIGQIATPEIVKSIVAFDGSVIGDNEGIKEFCESLDSFFGIGSFVGNSENLSYSPIGKIIVNYKMGVSIQMEIAKVHESSVYGKSGIFGYYTFPRGKWMFRLEKIPSILKIPEPDK